MDEKYKKKLLIIIYIATTFYALHNFTTYFVFSDYLSQYFSRFNLSIIYSISAFSTILISNFFGNFLKRFTNYKTLMTVVMLQIFSTMILSISGYLNLYILTFFAIIHIVFATLIWVSINIFTEEFSDHDNIGSIRGIMLTLYNLQAIIAPFLASQFFGLIGYTGIFIFSSISLIPLLFLIRKFFNHVKEPKYKHVNLFNSFKLVWKDKDIKGVIASSFALNSFYAVTNIYLILYLTKVIGIPTLLYIGVIVPISVIPFILIPYKLGKYSDEIFGEKRAMIFGILLTSLTMISIFIFKITTTNIIIWALILFIARLGATIAETENYSYFYKKIDSRSTGLIALFQNMVNVGFLFMSLLGAIFIGLLNINITFMFMLVGIIGIISIFIIIKIRDTEIKKRVINENNEKAYTSLTLDEEKKEKEAEMVWQENTN